MHANVRNNMLIDFNSLYLNEDIIRVETTEEMYKAYLEDKDRVIYQDNRIILNPNYEKEKAQKEQERVMKLYMTPLDFLKALNKIGISYETVKQIMEANPEVEMEMKFCQNVYRGHPMIIQFAKQFGVSEETLDHIFKVANGEEE